MVSSAPLYTAAVGLVVPHHLQAQVQPEAKTSHCGPLMLLSPAEKANVTFDTQAKDS